MRKIITFMSIALLWCVQAAYAQENSAGSQHLYYVEDGNGHILETLWTATSGGWHTTDLTVATNAPTTTTKVGLTSMYDSFGTEVFYVSGGSIYQLYWNPGTNAWTYSQRCGLCAMGTSPLTGFVNSKGEHVYYITPQGGIAELFYNSSTHSWSTATLPTAGGTIQAMASYAYGAINEHIFYTTNLGYVYEDFYDGSSYHLTNLSSLNNGYATSNSGIAAETDSNGQEIAFSASGGVGGLHYQFWVPVNGQWYNEATDSTGPTGSNKSITGFANSVGEHFFFVTSDQKVHEAFYDYNNAYWVDNDLTSQTGIYAATNTNLTSFSNGAYDEHLYFRGSNSALYEFHWTGTLGQPWIATAIGGVFGSVDAALTSFVHN